MITKGKIWHDSTFTSYDDHETCQKHVKIFVREMNDGTEDE